MAVHRVGETLLIDEFAAPMDIPTGVREHNVYRERERERERERSSLYHKDIHCIPV